MKHFDATPDLPEDLFHGELTPWGKYVTPILSTGDTMLDAGCGEGRVCQDLHSRYPNASYIGLDIVRYEKWKRLQEISDKIRFICCDMDDMDRHVALGSIGVIYSRNSLMYPPDKLRILMKMYRLLKISGLVYISMPLLRDFNIANMYFEPPLDVLLRDFFRGSFEILPLPKSCVSYNVLIIRKLDELPVNPEMNQYTCLPRSLPGQYFGWKSVYTYTRS
ncbi:MAG: class I SAM-dependent methyltransferase [Candidatus Dojkabacteria bacterium]|nr:class I SAM-dependent methyltransferase [Candidatus Dojkabacteria bacterium]